MSTEWFDARYANINVANAARINEDVDPEEPMKVGEIAVVFDGDEAAIFYGHPDTIVAKLRAALAEAERHATAERTRPAEITLDLSIENTYEDGDEVTTTATATLPLPPFGDEEREEWANEHIMPLTGTGKTDGDAWYDVKVTASNMPDLIPVGQTYEFGY
jgi:hypothetical protein